MIGIELALKIAWAVFLFGPFALFLAPRIKGWRTP